MNLFQKTILCIFITGTTASCFSTLRPCNHLVVTTIFQRLCWVLMSSWQTYNYRYQWYQTYSFTSTWLWVFVTQTNRPYCQYKTFKSSLNIMQNINYHNTSTLVWYKITDNGVSDNYFPFLHVPFSLITLEW